MYVWYNISEVRATWSSARTGRCTALSNHLMEMSTSLLSLVDKVAQSSLSDPAIGSISSRIEQKTWFRQVHRQSQWCMYFRLFHKIRVFCKVQKRTSREWKNKIISFFPNFKFLQRQTENQKRISTRDKVHRDNFHHVQKQDYFFSAIINFLHNLMENQ